jgi:hypothetical protein
MPRTYSTRQQVFWVDGIAAPWHLLHMAKRKPGRPKGENLPVQRSVRFDVDTVAALAKAAEAAHISEAEVIRRCVHDFVRGHYLPTLLRV